MVTHNLRYALEYGNRLLMMHEGGVILDKKGEEKQAVRMEELLKIFNEISIECGKLNEEKGAVTPFFCFV